MMKTKVKPLSWVLPCLLFFYVSGGQVFGQEKVNISAGVGFAETLNLGFRLQVLDQSQIALSIGTWPSPGENSLIGWGSLIALSGDFYYHFGDSARFSSLSPWYTRFGLEYIRIADESYTDNNLESHLRFGRDFYITRNYGISLDAGVAFFLKNESGFTSVLPAFGAALFLRF